MNLVELIEKEQITKEAPQFNVGDTVKVHFKIVEGTKERIQIFEGLVIARKNGGIRETFTVRKISFGVGVERTFPVFSPRIDKVEVIREGQVRRAKLYYIRDLSGKAASKVKEKKTANIEKKEVKTASQKLEALKANKAKPTVKSTKPKAAAKPAPKAKPVKKEAPKTEEPKPETPAAE